MKMEAAWTSDMRRYVVTVMLLQWDYSRNIKGYQEIWLLFASH